MKLESLSALCLSLLLCRAPFSAARKGGGGGFGKGFGSRKPSTSNRGNANRNTAGSSSQGGGGYPKQPAQPNPPQAGRPGNPGGHPHQQPGGGYPNQYPARGSPYGGGGYGGGQGGYAGHGGQGGYGGGYMNQNPNNRVLSPQYGGSFGYGGQRAGGGSPFSHSVHAMGMRPSDRSRGFGRNAAMAAAGGAVAGMALGYGLGRFPRPPFSFHNPQEEHYYNHYMYRRYGTRSTDANDYSKDRYSQPSVTYDSYMDACMKRTDVLPAENRKANGNKPAAATATAGVGSASNATETANGTAAGDSSTAAPSTPEPPASRVVSSVDEDDGDEDGGDTVSIVEIGYPALIEQVQARRCLELYMVFSEKYLKRPTGGARRPEAGWPGFVAVVTSATLMLLHGNVLTSLH